MPVSLTIPLLSILATPEVTEGIKQKTLEGGKHAEYVLERCIEDSRDIHQGFYLEIPTIQVVPIFYRVKSWKPQQARFMPLKASTLRDHS